MTPFKIIYNDCIKVIDPKNKDNLSDILANCLGYQGLCNAYTKLFETIGRLEDTNKELKETIQKQEVKIKELTPKKPKKDTK